MNPNNTSQTTTQPNQPVQSVNQSSGMESYPRENHNRTTLLLLILIFAFIVAGIAIYFVNNKSLFLQKTEETGISTPTPTTEAATPTPRPAAPSSIDEVIIENPEVDLQELQTEVQTL